MLKSVAPGDLLKVNIHEQPRHRRQTSFSDQRQCPCARGLQGRNGRVKLLLVQDLAHLVHAEAGLLLLRERVGLPCAHVLLRAVGRYLVQDPPGREGLGGGSPGTRGPPGSHYYYIIKYIDNNYY